MRSSGTKEQNYLRIYWRSRKWQIYHPLSVASSPTEGVVKITTGISADPSDFKKALLELEKGMTISMSGPVGLFYSKNSSPSLFIAAWIGITPFRAMIKQMEIEGTGFEKQVKLLYLDSGKSYIYKDELDKNTSIEVTYFETIHDLYQEIDTFITTHNNDGNYLIAGSKPNVEAITNHLKNKNISKQNIKKDVFRGVH
jgi:ferredoxin-NADP reductase